MNTDRARSRSFPGVGTDADGPEDRGAYGLTVPSDWPAERFVASPAAWTRWRFEWVQEDVRREPERVDDDIAVLNIEPAGQVVIERDVARSTLRLAHEPTNEAWVHPHLASTAVTAARWAGREPFHGGALVVDGRVWGVLGEREAGKSSVLAWSHLHGVPIFSDDVLVIDGESVLAGPRCIDLREGAAAQFGIGTPIGVAGSRERWRVPLGPIEPVLPFGGWVVLDWSDELSVTDVPPPSRLRLLLAARAVLLPEHDAPAWLRLLQWPVLAFRRPKRWDQVDGAMARLFDELSRR